MDNGGDGSFNNDNLLNAIYTPGVNDISGGNVTLTLTTTGTSVCTITDNVNVVIHTTQPLTPGTVSGPSEVCPPLSNVICSIVPVAGADSYSWTLGAGTNGVTFNGSTTGSSVDVNLASSTNSGYTLKVMAVNSCGSSASQASIFIRRSVSTPTAIAGATFACGGDVKPYSCPAVSGASGYLWTGPSGSLIDGNSSPYISPSNSVNVTFPGGFTGGTVSVAATVGCFTSTGRTITINNTPPQPGVITGATIGCPGSTQAYSVVAVPGAVIYNWTLPAGTTGSSTSNSINVTFGATYNAGNISVSVTNVCSLTGASRIKGLGKGTPTTPITISSVNGLFGLCNQTLVLNAPAVAGATSYTWAVPSGATINSGQGSNSINATFGSFGSASVCVTANNSCGSGTPRCVAVKGAPTIPGSIIDSPGSFCANATGVDFQVSSTFGTTGYTWVFPAGVNTVLNLGNEQVVDWGSNSGTVLVTVYNSCGNSTKTLPVTLGCREASASQGNDVPESEIKLFPNPAHDVLSVSF